MSDDSRDIGLSEAIDNLKASIAISIEPIIIPIIEALNGFLVRHIEDSKLRKFMLYLSIAILCLAVLGVTINE